MPQLRCTYCGGALLDQGVYYQCDSCRTKIKKSAMERLSEQDVFELNAARLLKESYRFQEAQVAYDAILGRNPDCEEAAWGAFLAEYGIEYQVVEQKPTFHALSPEPTYHSRYYAHLSQEHRQEADNVIEEKRREIMRSVEQLPAYDVFLSLKIDEDNGAKTPEYDWATQLYYDLREQGYRVFFSPQVLKQSNADWEPYIYRAIQTCRIMLVLTSSIEHANAPWVRNEWRRILSRIANTPEGETKPTFRVIAADVNCVPPELLSKQVLQYGDYHLRELIDKAVQDACLKKTAGGHRDNTSEGARRFDDAETTAPPLIQMPSGAGTAENYIILEKILRDAGFTNVQSFALQDMVGLNRFSWTNGAVVSIKVDGVPYRSGVKKQFFSPSASIIVTYHSLPEGSKEQASPFQNAFDKGKAQQQKWQEQRQQRQQQWQQQQQKWQEQRQQRQQQTEDSPFEERTSKQTTQRVRTQSGKIYVQCPSCGASTPIEANRDEAFCVVCGVKIQYDVEKTPPFAGTGGQSSFYGQGQQNAKSLSTRPINKWIALVLCIFLGLFGVHRFYEGKKGTAILFLCTRGLLYVGWVIDIIRILRQPNPYYVKAKQR